MTQGLARHRGALVALLATLLALTTASPLTAGEPKPDSNLAFVPGDAPFVTARVAELARKLGSKDADLAWLKQVGIPIGLVERCTIVGLGSNADDRALCIIVRTSRPYQRDEVLKTWASDAREVQIQGKACHVSATTGTALYFASDRLLLVGDKDRALPRCLDQADKPTAGTKAFADALKLTGQHDLVAWGRAVPGKEPTATLPYLPLPLPDGVEAALATLDVGDQLAIEVQLQCANEAGAMRAEKGLRVLLNMAHCMALQGVAEFDMAEAFPSLAQKENLRGLPTKLIRQAEKGFHNARLQTTGKTASLSLTIPVDAKTVCSEVESGLRMEAESNGCQAGGRPPIPFFPASTWVNGSSTLPAGRYLQQPPQYEGGLQPASFSSSGVPAGRSTTDGPQTATPVTSPPNVGSPSCFGIPTAGGPQMAAPALTSASPNFSNPSTCGTPTVYSSSVLPLSAASAPSAPVKLTVANVRKETALLFTIADSGKLTFSQKLPPGEAIDLQTTSGQRWVAVFMDKPAGETFTPAQPEATWLLR